MRNRLFLLALLTAVIIIQAVLRSAAVATPFTGGSTLGGFTFWELRRVLPLGVFAAGALLFSCAATAQCAQAALQFSSRSSTSLAHQLSSIASAGIWCGAPCMASCYNALPCIFPWLNDFNSDSWQTTQHLEWLLHGSIITLILCRLLSRSKHPAAAYATLPLAMLCLLACGQMWFGLSLILLPIGLMAAGGAAMLFGRGRRWAIIPLLTAAIMVPVLFMFSISGYFPQPAPAISEQAVWVTYACTLLLLAPAFFLKASSLRS